MPGKLRFRWTGPFWIVDKFSETYQLGTLAGDVSPKWANGFQMKLNIGTTPPNPFSEKSPDYRTPEIGYKEVDVGLTPQLG